MNRPRHTGLQWKLTVAVVAIVIVPLVASAILIDQIGKVAANFGATESKERASMIEQVSRVYRDLVSTTKSLQVEVAQRIASRPDIANPIPEITLEKILDEEANLRAIAVLRPDGSVVDEASKPVEPDETKWRDAVVDHQLPNGSSLRLTFRVIDTSN
ncbi:MAG TPA: hypothetical protein VFV99_32300, partial [Kofleriaceae bacterium]|nr:hypothetical protein [Kofleriaceae bacterium]